MAVDRDASVTRVVEARKELCNRRFAGTGVADQGDGRSCRHIEVEVVQDVRALAVAEAHVLEAHVAGDRRQRLCAGTVVHLGRLVHDVHDLVQRSRRREEGVVQL